MFLSLKKVSMEALNHYSEILIGSFYIPYQFSTMKVFECLRAGVVLVVPSEAMFKEMIEQLMKDKSDEFALHSQLQYHRSMNYYQIHSSSAPQLSDSRMLTRRTVPSLLSSYLSACSSDDGPAGISRTQIVF